MQISILIPAFNEEKTISQVLDTVLDLPLDMEIIVIDDGSKDHTPQILDQIKSTLDASGRAENFVVIHKPNGGKGSAIRAGLEQARGDFTVIQDADLEYNPSEISLLLKEALEHPGEAVFGSRFLRPNPKIYWRFWLGNKGMTMAINLFFFGHLTDSYTCYKLLPTPLFRSLNLQARAFEMEAEICSLCLKRGVRIREIPVSYRPRTIAEGKKIGWRDVVTGLKTMLKIRFSSR
jgi:glycosyltransferase involved in cell wall biosynthesis